MRTLTLGLLLLAGSIRVAGAQSAEMLSGSYGGDIAGTPSTLTLERSGGSISGAIDAGGYGYVLNGTASGSSGRGTLTDHQTGVEMEFEIVEQGGAVTVTILAMDPTTGQVQRSPFEFRRSNASAEYDGVTGGNAEQNHERAGHDGGNPAYGAGGQEKGQRPGQSISVERDPALIGAWSYSDTYISNDALSSFSATTRYFMQVNPDGSYAYGSGGMSAGLDNDLGSVQGSAGAGDVARGQWRTENGVIHIMEAGSAQWTPYARYYIKDSALMLTYGNGKRQVWYRR